jgi:DNA-directed RNA polymerase subunit RPC12/RpoP
MKVVQMRLTYELKKQCIICGKEFNVRIRKKNGKIMSKCFYSTISKNIFSGWMWEIVDTKKRNFMSKKNCKVCFKNKFWKIVAYTPLQRWIIYKIWWIFEGWQKVEYWECPKCSSS